MIITLATIKDTIRVSCAGVALHGADGAGIHGLSKNGKAWVEKQDEPITVTSKNGEYRLTEVTDAPLP